MDTINRKTEDSHGREMFLFHTLLGNFPRHLISYLRRLGINTEYKKLDNFLYGAGDIASVENRLGLAHREIMCTLSTKETAVYYHAPFGLIIDGEVRICYDNDSGLQYNEHGEYTGAPFHFTHETGIQAIADNYDKIHPVNVFKWTEVILRPGARIIGAFIDKERALLCSQEEEENVKRFLDRSNHLNLPLLEVQRRTGR